MHARHLIVCLGFILALIAAAQDTREHFALTPRWQMQAAESAQTPPDTHRWSLTVPGARRMRPQSGWYRKWIAIPERWRNRRILLDFPHSADAAVIFIDGRRVEEAAEPGGEIEITRFTSPGEHELLIHATQPDHGLPALPVAVLARPLPVSLSAVRIETSWRLRELTVSYRLFADHPVAEMTVYWEVLDDQGRQVLRWRSWLGEVPRGSSEWRTSQDWAEPILWELDAPHLYHLRAVVAMEGRIMDRPPAHRFGFREVWTERGHVMLNGHVSRWRLDPMAGLTPDNLAFFQSLGFNVAWRPDADPTHELLDALDKAGIGICLPAPPPAHQADWLHEYGEHPSILAWVGNDAPAATRSDGSPLVIGGANGDIATARGIGQSRNERPLLIEEEPLTMTAEPVLLTEHLAMVLGDRAYLQEPAESLRHLALFPPADVPLHEALSQWFPAWWRAYSRHTEATIRSLRTGDLTGGILPGSAIGYGDPSAWGRRTWTESHGTFNQNSDIVAPLMQPLLVWLAGEGPYTDRRDAWYGGEELRKQIAWVWDGPGSWHGRLSWRLTMGDAMVAGGTIARQMQAGEIAFDPISVMLPIVSERTPLAITLQLHGRTIDRFTGTLWPRHLAGNPPGAIALHAPNRDGAWLNAWIPNALPWPGETKPELLIVAPRALTPHQPLPWSADDIAAGLRVLILAQRPELWQALGLHTNTLAADRAVVRGRHHPILAGLADEAFANWRPPVGLPAAQEPQALAAVTLAVPRVVGFQPLLASGFDLGYSPLIEWRYGRGSILFCTLDLDGRVGTDPAATEIFHRLLQSGSHPLVPTAPAMFSGTPAEAQLLTVLGAWTSETAEEASVLIGGNARQAARQIAGGGTTIQLPGARRRQPRWIVHGYTPTLESPLLRDVGPELLRWRDPVPVPAASPDAIANGAFSWHQLGGGQIFTFHLAPDELTIRRSPESAEARSLTFSQANLYRLYAQVLTNAGVASTPAVANRICMLEPGPRFRPLTEWQVLAPVQDRSKLPGLEDALSGAIDATARYPTPEGGWLSWEPVTADATNQVNLSTADDGPTHASALAVTRIAAAEAQPARLRFTFDGRGTAWLNGIQLDIRGLSPRGPASVDVELDAGDNVLALQVTPGDGRFKAELATEIPPGADTAANLYPGGSPPWDPRDYRYW